MYEDKHSSCRGLYFILTSDIYEASLNLMVHVWLEGGVLVKISLDKLL